MDVVMAFKKYTKYCVITFIAVLLVAILSLLRAVDIRLSIAIQPIVFSFFTYRVLCAKDKMNCSAFVSVMAICLGACSLELPIRIIHWEETLGTVLPLVCTCISIFSTYLYYQYRFKSVLIILAACFIWIYCIFGGQKHLMNYIDFGHISSSICVSNGIGNAIIYKTTGDSLCLRDLKQKYLLLDFWNAGCGVCYMKFPLIQELYDKYKQRDDIFISGVYVKNKRDEHLDLGASILLERGYTFSTFVTEQETDFFQKSGIKVYPTVLILDEDRNIVYMGSVDDVSDKLKKLLND